jgi:hypothetical protein
MKRSKVKGIILRSYFPTSACIFLMPELLDSKKCFHIVILIWKRHMIGSYRGFLESFSEKSLEVERSSEL